MENVPPLTAGSDWFDMVLHLTSRALECAGVVAIVIGAIMAIRASLKVLRTSGDQSASYHALRLGLGRAILLGLELLVAADIIGTIAVQPTLQNVLILALIVLIRTFLSISLTVEIEGRWPWQISGQKRGGSDD